MYLLLHSQTQCRWPPLLFHERIHLFLPTCKTYLQIHFQSSPTKPTFRPSPNLLWFVFAEVTCDWLGKVWYCGSSKMEVQQRFWVFAEVWVNEYFKIFFLNAATGKATWLRAPETLLVSLLLLLFLGLLALHPSFQLSFLSQVGCCVMSSLKLFEEMIEPKFPSLDFVWVIFLHQFIKMLS